MSSNIKKENFKLTSYLRRTYAETAVEGEVLVPDYYPGVMRIIRTEATPFIQSKTVREGKVDIEGSVGFRVIYVCENGTLQSFNTAMPFSQNIDTKSENLALCTVTAQTAYASTRALNPQKLYFKATVSVFADAIQESDVATVRRSEEKNDIYMLTDMLPTISVLLNVQKTVRAADEINVNKKVTQIIRHDATVCETERRVNNGKLIIKGDLSIKVIYVNAETSGIETTVQKTGFSQVFDVKDIDENGVFDINCEISEINVSLSTNSAETDSTIVYDSEICISAIAYKNSEEEICLDVFSSENELNISKDTVSGQKILNVKKEFSVRDTLSVGNYKKVHDVSVTASLEKAEYMAESGIMAVSGDIHCLILYTDAENDYVSTEKLIPFEVRLPAEAGGNAAVAKCSTNINAGVFADVDDKNIEMRIEAVCFGTITVLNPQQIIVNVENGERKTQRRDAGITIYYAEKDESVFSIAKRYSVDPENIKRTNGVSDFTDKNRPLII